MQVATRGPRTAETQGPAKDPCTRTARGLLPRQAAKVQCETPCHPCPPATCPNTCTLVLA